MRLEPLSRPAPAPLPSAAIDSMATKAYLPENKGTCYAVSASVVHNYYAEQAGKDRTLQPRGVKLLMGRLPKDKRGFRTVDCFRQLKMKGKSISLDSSRADLHRGVASELEAGRPVVFTLKMDSGSLHAVTITAIENRDGKSYARVRDALRSANDGPDNIDRVEELTVDDRGRFWLDGEDRLTGAFKTKSPY